LPFTVVPMFWRQPSFAQIVAGEALIYSTENSPTMLAQSVLL
jgi:hypothetical protein